MGATRKQDNRTAIGQQAPVSVLLREFGALITQRIRQLTGIPTRSERLTLSTIREMHGAGAVVAGQDVRWDPVRERLSMMVRDEGGVPHIAEWTIRGVDARTCEDSRSDQLVANCFWAETPAGPRWCGLFASGNTGPGQWRSGSVVEMRRAEGRRDTPRDDRLTQLGAMASTLSHELKQPLATIAFAAENGKLRLVGQTDTRSEKALDKLDVEGDEKMGASIVRNALRYPLEAIAENAGTDGSVVVNRVRQLKGKNDGYDADKGEYCDLVSAGVIDPAKVVRTALQNAASVAALLLTTDSLITEIPKDEEPAGGDGHDHGMGGMGGMGGGMPGMGGMGGMGMGGMGGMM